MVKGRQSYSQSDNVLPFENNLRFGKGFDDEFATASNKILWYMRKRAVISKCMMDCDDDDEL